MLKALERPALFCAVKEYFGPDSHLHYNRFYSTLSVEGSHAMNIDHSNLKLLCIIEGNTMKMEIGSPIFKACQQVSIKPGKRLLLPGQWEVTSFPGGSGTALLSLVLCGR